MNSAKHEIPSVGSVGSVVSAEAVRLLLLATLVAALPVRAGGPARAWDLTPHEKRYSQFNEELVIRHFFSDRKGGVFVGVVPCAVDLL